jgi:hypothetical protein
MNAWMRMGMLAGFLGLVVAAPGCSLSSLAYFLMPEQQLPPDLCSLTSPDHKQQVSVVILASTVDPLPKPGCNQIARDLSERVARQLHELCMTNKDNIRIVSPRRVEEYKSKHSDWQQMHPAEIGKEFKADLVINLEISSISLMDKDSYAELYRGRIEMEITLVDVHHPDYTPESRGLSDVWPDEARPVPRENMPPGQFRATFLDRIAKRVACLFAAHPREEHQPNTKAAFGNE